MIQSKHNYVLGAQKNCLNEQCYLSGGMSQLCTLYVYPTVPVQYNEFDE